MSTLNSTLAGKVVVVTGGGGGIGRAVCEHMATQGARVIVNDLGVTLAGDQAGVNAVDVVVEAIRAKGGQAVANTMSVTDRTSGPAIVEQAMDEFGQLDIVINNAGIIRMAPFEEMTLSNWQAVFATNLLGAVYLSHAASQQFVKQGSGSYVHLTSASGLIGSTQQVNYASAKLGIVGLSSALARDLGPLGIRSNCIAPSSTSRMTELTDNARKHLLTPEAAEKLRLARLASMPENMAPVIGFLGSDAAHQLNGQIVGARGNELYLYSQPRAVRDVRSSGGWTQDWFAENLAQVWAAYQTKLDVITDVFSWAPA
ncbi:SDR family NAD(P)-dependent oxidoreductase [Devosia sp. MC532]|uniref:SDR family NAD(P)-dependent oxidoreductase n=1 Tax=Devosia sp. MC532 TaxID=2799788 RepID=UPI0018F515E2|nr:SDR family NAD(P)-dependent oxidoreductase [Devosia sp. MC532]MBJ7577852.1 SDR family NAD(P)-dependent oxidoreductase [Devosia sp. MC532]